MSRGVRAMFATVFALVVAAVAYLAPERAAFTAVGGGGWWVSLPALLVTIALGGVVVGWLAARGARSGQGHDPRLLLPLVLPRRLRRTITRAYEAGAMDEALDEVLKEREQAPHSLGLQYWAIRLLLEAGRTEDARAELVALLPNLPEAALTIRWSSLYERAGEQDIWIRNVLDRIRSGLVVRRSTFRELVRLLEAAHRYADALDVLDRLREIDPPTPEEEGDLTQTEMSLRVRIADLYLESGRAEDAMAEIRRVRARFSGWRSPYQVGQRALALAGRQSEADEWLLEGFRNVGDPDLLITVYERQIRGTDPVTLLEAWDESLKDLSDDGWYLLTTAWIAQRHGLTEEAIERFRRIPPDSPAWAHSQILRGAFDARRGHAQDAAAALSTATWAWIRLPFVWRCAGCGEISRQANYLCSTCGGWESFRMIRPYGSEEALAAKLVG